MVVEDKEKKRGGKGVYFKHHLIENRTRAENDDPLFCVLNKNEPTPVFHGLDQLITYCMSHRDENFKYVSYTIKPGFACPIKSKT